MTLLIRIYFNAVCGGLGGLLGWMLFGMAVGISEGIAARSLGKFSYGAIGGTIGGFIGGAMYFPFIHSTSSGASTSGQGSSLAAGSALGLVIVGACIGSLSALVR